MYSKKYGPLLLVFQLSIIWIACSVVRTIQGSHLKLDTNEKSIKLVSPSCIMNNQAKNTVKRPIIGILTQVLRDYKRFVEHRHLHIASSYVKWIEGSGAQVLPILLNQNDSYYERVFNQTNGLLITGGDNLLNPRKDTPLMVAAKKLYKLAKEANDRGDYYPIWGTCLGLELLSVLSSDKNVLEQCSANDLALNMKFIARGRLFAPSDYAGLTDQHDFSKSIVNALETQNLTYNFHHKCLTDNGLRKAGLEDFYRPLAYSEDLSGLKFIAIFEAFNYPFYGVQFHPEKPAYEFVVKKGQYNIPHSKRSIAVSRYFADFFIAAAQLNGHEVCDMTMEFRRSLIYSHNPMYTALKNDMYEQRYLFPFQENGSTTEEFLDYLPDENDEAPEDIEETEARGNYLDINEVVELYSRDKIDANKYIPNFREKFEKSGLVDSEDYNELVDQAIKAERNH